MRFKIDWAGLMVGRKFTFLLCFTLYLRAISKYNPPAPPPGSGGFYLEGQCNGGFFALRVWRAYTRRGLFSEFYCIFRLSFHICISCVLYREDERYEIHVQSTPALRTPRYYGQFALSPGKEKSYIFSKFTPLKRTLSMSPSVSVLTGFDCIFIISRLGYVKLNQSTSPC